MQFKLFAPCVSVTFLAAAFAHAEKPVKVGDPGLVEIRITQLIATPSKFYGTVEVVETKDEVVDGKKTRQIIQRINLLNIPKSRPFVSIGGGYAGDMTGTEAKAELFSNWTGKKSGHTVHMGAFKTKLGTPLEIRTDLKRITDDGEVPLIPLDPDKNILIAGHIKEDSRTRGELDFWDERYNSSLYLRYKDIDPNKQFLSISFNVYIQNDYLERAKTAKHNDKSSVQDSE